MEVTGLADGGCRASGKEARLRHGIQRSGDGHSWCWSSHRQVVPEERYRSPNDLN